jgi:excisionase family DNA binding protein
METTQNVKSPTLPPDALLTSHEVGEMLQMDPSSVAKWVNAGKLKAFRTPGGHRRIRVDELVRFLKTTGMFVPGQLGGRKTVLAVDDDHRYLTALTRQFKSHKDQVELLTCDNGVDALIHIGAQKPDVLLLDLQMPGMDGLEVCKRLSQQKLLQGLTIIVVTGAKSPDIEKAFIAAGAKAVLSKPLDLNKLFELIDIQVEASRTT